MIVTMVTHKLEKEVVLYKNQFEEFVLDIFKEHKMERLSIDIDALLFRIKYMAKNHKESKAPRQLPRRFAFFYCSSGGILPVLIWVS